MGQLNCFFLIDKVNVFLEVYLTKQSRMMDH